MHSNRFWELMAKQLSGELTPNEAQELQYLKGEDEFIHYNDALQAATTALSFQYKEEITDEAPQEKWKQLQQKINASSIEQPAKPVPFKLRIFIKYGAVAASFLLAVFMVWKWLERPPVAKSSRPNIVSTKNGSRSKIQMPDGTQVWLNAGSALKYNNDNYGIALREVELVGEAYFDVVKDAAHPFIIHTSAMDVKVVGTAFNIRAYPNEKQTETSLIRGSIEVSFPGRPAEKLFLKPNEKITIANHRPQLATDKVSSEQPTETSEPIIVLSTIAWEPADSAVTETSWTRNQLIFRNKNFDELAQDMERWYNVSILFRDSSLMQRHLTGTFRNETVFEALNYLKLSSPFQYHFSKETNTIELYR